MKKIIIHLSAVLFVFGLFYFPFGLTAEVSAQNFATKNGKLSADSNRISWSDGVVWVRQ